jgi:hypothetical protein
MLIEAAFVMSSFVILFYCGSGSTKAKSYGSYGSGSATLITYKPQKVGSGTVEEKP